TVFGAIAGTFAVDSLRARNHDFFYRQAFFADNFEHLRRAEGIHVDEFCKLRHVTAIRSLMEDDIDVVYRGSDRIAIAQIRFDEFRLFVNPRWLPPPVGLGLEIIQPTHVPALPHENIDNVGPDKACGTSD